MPEYLKLRNAVLIVDPKDRAGLEGGGAADTTGEG